MIIKVPLTNIHANPYQPESRLDIPEDIAEKFGKSILEHGLLQTPVARRSKCLIVDHRAEPPKERIEDAPGHYQMGDGWLRLAGFQWLVRIGHPEFKEMPLDVRELSDRQMADLVLEANTVRKDMTPIDEAKLYKRYLEDFGITQDELARSHNLTQGALANKLRLLELPAEVQGKIISQEITETHGRQLLRLNYNPDLQKTVTADAVKAQMTVDQLSNTIAREIFNSSENMEESYNGGYPPAFDIKECAGCKNYQKIGEPYSSDRKSWRCLDAKCWDKKQTAAEKKIQEEIAAKAQEEGAGTKILTSNDISYNQKEDLNDRVLKELDNPEECKSCAKTALYRYSHNTGGAPTRICLNPTCFRAKKSKKTREVHVKEKKQDQALTAKIQDAIQGLAGASSVRNCLLVLALDNLSRLTNQDAKNDMLQFFPQFPTAKGKLDLEATKKALLTTRAVWTTDDLVRICAAAIITRQRRKYSGSISPQLTGKVKKDYAILTGTMDDYLKEVRSFEAANCKGCGHAKKGLLGTGEDCCEAPYYRHLDEAGKCTGNTVKSWNDMDKSDVPAADPEEDEWDERMEESDILYHSDEDIIAMANQECSEVEERSSAIPAGVRLCEEVPNEECAKCKLNTHDHTVNLSFPVKHNDGVAYQKVCLKDYAEFGMVEAGVIDQEKYPALFGKG